MSDSRAIRIAVRALAARVAPNHDRSVPDGDARRGDDACDFWVVSRAGPANRRSGGGSHARWIAAPALKSGRRLFIADGRT